MRQLLIAARQRAVMAEVEVERLRARVLELEAGTEPSTSLPGSSVEPADPVPPGTPEPLPEDLEWPSQPAEGGLVEEDIDDDYQPPPALDLQPAGEPLEPEDSADSEDSSSVGILNTDPPNREAFELYDRGYSLFHQEQYREAETLFERYIAEHPTTELADNALFWIGECRYARREFEDALEAFTETVVRFPGGNKVPDALLKAGKCLEALGRPDEAGVTYRELTSRYPGSLAALAAEERLAAL